MTHQALSLTPSRPNSTWPSWVPWSQGALDEGTSTKKQMLVKGRGKHKVTWYYLFRYEKQPWISWLHETSNDCIGLLMINEPKLQQCDTRTSSTTVGNTLSSYKRKREKMWNVKSCQAVTHRCQAFFAVQCLKELRMSKSVRTRGLDYVSSLTSAWNAFSEEHSAGRKCKCLDHWHLSAGDRAYIGMRHRSSTWSWGQPKKMDHDDLTHCVPCTNPSKHIAIPLPQIASLSVKVQKLGAQTQALAQLHCTAPREPSHLEKTQVPPVHLLHLCLLWCWEFGGKW